MHPKDKERILDNLYWILGEHLYHGVHTAIAELELDEAKALRRIVYPQKEGRKRLTQAVRAALECTP